MCKGTAFFLYGKRQAFVCKNDDFRTKKEDPFGSSLPNTFNTYVKDSFEFLAIRRSGCRFVHKHRLRAISSAQGEVDAGVTAILCTD